VVREMLNHDAYINTAHKDVWTALNKGGQNGLIEVVTELLNHGANL